MATPREYALLSAWANSAMDDPVNDPGHIGIAAGGGQLTQNFIKPDGWEISQIRLADIAAVRPGTHLAALSTVSLAGMAAFVFTKGTETVIAFRGTQMDEGLILGPGRDDAIADWGLGV